MKRSYSFAHLASAVFFSVIATALITVTVVRQFGISAAQNIKPYSDKVEEIMALVDEYYVGEVDEEILADYIAMGCVAGLEDKYAGYYTAEDADARFDSLYGYFTGMGVQISLHPDNNTMYVFEVHKNSPAMEAGILPGDEIVAVDSLNVVTDGYDTVLNYIKSQSIGSTLKVSVERNGETVDFEVKLRQFDSQSVFYKLIDNIGYIHITEFNDLGAEQFKTAVNELTSAGAKSLVFDLRNNGGGTVTSVTNMLDFLVPEGVILETRYKNSKNNTTVMSDKNEVDLPMAVLINEGSASASELFAQNLKDYGKAVTIGCNSYGKGVVQRTFTLSDGSLAVFTIAKYYTKSGYCPDGQGVSADIETEWTDDELRYRYVNGIEADKDYIKAVEYLNGQLS